jgi:hypothetical protein
MATHVKVLASLFVVVAVLLLLGAMFFPVVLGLVASLVKSSNEPDAETASTILGLTGTFLSIVLVTVAIPYAICAYGLFKMRPWGRIMGIIMSAMSLLKVPFGTLIGIYGLIVLFQKKTEELFVP